MGIDRTGPVGPFRPIHDASGRDSARAEQPLPTPPARSPREDSIELSDEARVLNEASAEDRDVLVERLRRQVASGAYEVDASQVAREMVDHGDA